MDEVLHRKNGKFPFCSQNLRFGATLFFFWCLVIFFGGLRKEKKGLSVRFQLFCLVFFVGNLDGRLKSALCDLMGDSLPWESNKKPPTEWIFPILKAHLQSIF